MDQFVLATANEQKASEIRAILGDNFYLLPRPLSVAEVSEVGSTLLENARLKAEAVARETGQPALADDTGIEVEALGGRPGVHSARFAGKSATASDNIRKILAELADMPPTAGRSARYRTVAVLRFPDGGELAAEGIVEGSISTEPRGSGGFGFDPIFVPNEGDGRTFAEMSTGEKAAMSHRGRAFTKLKALIYARDAASGSTA